MKNISWILIALFLFAFIVRVFYLPQNALTFGYDQARDHLQAQAIITGDVKIQGPSASTPGLHHGVFWFYYLVPPTLVSGGNPIVSAYWNALFNAAVIFIVYSITKLFVKSNKAALIASILYAVSFESSQYATWLSNPTVAAWSVPLMYWGLWIWTQNKSSSITLSRFAPLITGVGLGISIHANVFLLYHSVPVIIWLAASRKNNTSEKLGIFIGTLLLVLSPMILSELKFGFRGIGGVLSLLATEDAVIASKQFGDFILLFFNQIGKVYAYNSYPGNIGYGAIAVIALLIVSIRAWQNTPKPENIWMPFLVTWLLAHSTVVTVGGASTPFLLVGIGPAVSILLGIYLAKLWNAQKFLSGVIILVLVAANISMIAKENKHGQTIFAIQKDMLLSKQLQAIDYTYIHSEGNQFSINTLTSPLYINIVWTYLYDWYGQTTYGYTPTWHGPDQVGQLASLERTTRTSEYYVIIEPLAGIPPRYLQELLDEENYYSEISEELVFGKELKVQKRIMIDTD